jgi:hypothetical protein
VSRAHRANHRNRLTGELLENREQVCPACYENFGTTEAGDAHRDLTSIPFLCIKPSQVGLIPTENKFGTMVWRIASDS